MNLRTERNCHAVFNLQYHLILVTKYRKPCITEEIFNDIKYHMDRLCKRQNVILEEINYEPDHVHMLINVPPQVNLAELINVLKSVTSRKLRQKYSTYLENYYKKPVFWSRSYMILSSGGAPIEIIKQYIKDQKGSRE